MAKTGRWPGDPISGLDYEYNVRTMTITAGLEKLSGGGDGVTTEPMTTTTSTEVAGTQGTASVGASTGSLPGLSAATSAPCPVI